LLYQNGAAIVFFMNAFFKFHFSKIKNRFSLQFIDLKIEQYFYQKKTS